MADRLKPCPFCGRKATTSEIERIENMPYGWGWVGCRPCRVFMDWSHGERGKKLAVEQWNTRKPMDRIVEALKKRSNEEGAEWVRLQRREEVRQVSNTDIHSYASSCYDDAIEIVKEGGKNEKYKEMAH